MKCLQSQKSPFTFNASLCLHFLAKFGLRGQKVQPEVAGAFYLLTTSYPTTPRRIQALLSVKRTSSAIESQKRICPLYKTKNSIFASFVCRKGYIKIFYMKILKLRRENTFFHGRSTPFFLPIAFKLSSSF